MYEYIYGWIEARKRSDKNEMDRIEKDLRKLGTDRMTLLYLANVLEEKIRK